MAAANLLNGAETSIFIDDHLSPGNANCSTSVDLEGIELIGLSLQTPTPMAFASGTVTAPWRNVTNLSISAPGGIAEQLANGQTLTIGYNTSLVDPFFSIAPGANVSVNQVGPSSTVGDGTNHVFVGSAGKTLNYFVGPGCALEPLALTGAMTVNLTVCAAAVGAGEQPNVAGSGGTLNVFSDGSPLARGWADNAGAVVPATSAATKVTSVTVTPTATGNFRVTCSGNMVNSSVSTAASGQMSLSHGALATPTDYNGSGAVLGITALAASQVPFSFVVDYDKLATPLQFPLGVAVTFNAVITTAGGSNVGINAHNCQLEVQEVY